MSSVCLIETGWTYIGAKSKYFNLDGTGPDEVLEESRAENSQDCAIYAYKVSKDHFDISKPAYWTYETDSKVCSVVLHKGYRSEAKGHISGSSDCKIAPGSNFKNHIQLLKLINMTVVQMCCHSLRIEDEIREVVK